MIIIKKTFISSNYIYNKWSLVLTLDALFALISYYITIIIFIYKILFFACNIILFNKILYDFYFIFYNLFHNNIYTLLINIICELKFNDAFNANCTKDDYYLLDGSS